MEYLVVEPMKTANMNAVELLRDDWFTLGLMRRVVYTLVTKRRRHRLFENGRWGV
jgi:hypothetical protein